MVFPQPWPYTGFNINIIIINVIDGRYYKDSIGWPYYTGFDINML